MSTTSYLEQYDAAADTEKSYLARAGLIPGLYLFSSNYAKMSYLVTPKFTRSCVSMRSGKC